MTLLLLLWSVALAQDTDTDAAAPVSAATEEAVQAERAEEIPSDAEEIPLTTASDEGGAAAAPADQDTDFTVIVIGQQQVRAARDQVVREMEALGWKTRRKRDGRVVFRGPEPWMGKMILNENGVVDFTTPSIAFGGTTGVDVDYSATPRSNMDPQTGSAGVAIGFDGKKKAAALQAEIRAAVADDVATWQDMIRKRGFGRMIESLPERLDAVWDKGEALDGGTASTPEARRKSILDYWASRTDTPEGRLVMRTIEGWLRNVVMLSEHPVTREEAAEAEAQRDDGRRLDVF